MHWCRRELWKVGVALAGLPFLLVLLVWVPREAADAQARAPGSAMLGTVIVQAMPTEDATVTALRKEQLTLQVKQLQDQLQNQNSWLVNNSTALIAAITAIIVAFIGFTQWAGTVRQAKDKDLKDREDERRKEVEAQDKDLKAQAEERFKTAVTALGDEKEGIQVGGAILLRSFLNKEDKKIYERYYTQIFDLAVANLRLPRTSHLPEEDPDALHTPPKTDSNAPLPLATLSQALIMVFRESFKLARDNSGNSDEENSGNSGKEKKALQSLDAAGIQLDHAYLKGEDLKQVWMPRASLRGADLRGAKLGAANLSGANLSGANLSGAELGVGNLSDGTKFGAAELSGANLSGADLERGWMQQTSLQGADLSGANLSGANLREADLSRATLSRATLSGATLSEATLYRANLYEADLRGANLSGIELGRADLRGADLENARSLRDTDLRGVKGLDDKRKAACKARGAIIDEDATTSPPQSPVSPSLPSQSNNVQVPSATPAQVNTPPPETDGSSTTSSKLSSAS